MSFSDLASVGSLLSGVAVVVSLVYLAVQVRHAEKTQRAMMHQARTERVVNGSLAAMQPDIAETMMKMSAAAELSPREMMQIYYFMRIQVALVDDALWQHEAGFLDQASLDTAILTIQRVMQFPACRAAWLMQRRQLAPALRDRMDAIVAEALAADMADWTGEYAEAYARAKAVAPAPQTPSTAA